MVVKINYYCCQVILKFGFYEDHIIIYIEKQIIISIKNKMKYKNNIVFYKNIENHLYGLNKYLWICIHLYRANSSTYILCISYSFFIIYK